MFLCVALFAVISNSAAKPPSALASLPRLMILMMVAGFDAVYSLLRLNVRQISVGSRIRIELYVFRPVVLQFSDLEYEYSGVFVFRGYTLYACHFANVLQFNELLLSASGGATGIKQKDKEAVTKEKKRNRISFLAGIGVFVILTLAIAICDSLGIHMLTNYFQPMSFGFVIFVYYTFWWKNRPGLYM